MFIDSHMAFPSPLQLLRALRPTQWAKNLLLAVPLLSGHMLGDVAKWQALGLAFVAFSLAASASYLLNDLLDRESDRQHPVKRHRPFASGALPLGLGLLLAPVLAAAAGWIALRWVNQPLAWALLGYLAATTLYSLVLKRLAVLDVIVLASLYTHRIIAGGLAVGLFPTPWLLAFSLFLFLSLAFAKRYAELVRLGQDNHRGPAHGRGYQVEDLDMIRTAGPVSGYLAVLVLCLYINSPGKDPATGGTLYAHPQWLWLLCPLMLYWISRLWLLAHRRRMTEDPLLFALGDPVSYLVAAAAAGVVVLASL